MSNKFIGRPNLTRLAMVLAFTVMLTGCINIPTIKKAGVSFDTTLIEVPKNTPWVSYEDAFEMINPFTMTVVFEDAAFPVSENPIPAEAWPEFKKPLPWIKNIKRNLQFDGAFMVGSPSVYKSGQVSETDFESNLVFLEIGGYTWMELAIVEAVTAYPGGVKPSGQIPEPGQVIFQTVVKPQVNRWDDVIYQMTDGKGNYFVMHATATIDGEPSLDVELPEGWTLERIEIDEPLIITPTVDGYYNIVMDNLGQGYHQYIYADDVFSSEYFLK
ncbi:hypothetical protein [Shewanella gaetbuli]